MDYNLKISRLKTCHNGSIANYRWQHFKNGTTKIEIDIANEKCPACDKFLFGPNNYPHIIEHEITECLTLNILYEDGLFNQFNPNNFNAIFSPNHRKQINHCCDQMNIVRRFG